MEYLDIIKLWQRKIPLQKYENLSLIDDKLGLTPRVARGYSAIKQFVS